MEITETPQRMLRTPQAAALVGLSRRTLEKLRVQGNGPVFHRLGARAVAYQVADLMNWLVERRHRSTSEYTAVGSK
jgi:predicted DNA-binding transcriptional regulator AlpA